VYVVRVAKINALAQRRGVHCHVVDVVVESLLQTTLNIHDFVQLLGLFDLGDRRVE
jgi:hypothetical protein